jgi:hypothetical protein
MTKGSMINHFLNPEEAVHANEETVKGLLHLNDWSQERPGLGAGENLFDAAMLFAPGLGEVGAGVKGTEAAGAAARTADAADAAGAVGRGGRALGEAGEFGRATGAMNDISKTASGLTKDLENIGADSPRGELPPGGRPGGLPPPKPAEVPAGPPRPVDSAPRAPGDRAAAPIPGNAERAAAPSPSEPSLRAGAESGEHLSSPGAELTEASPARVPVSPGDYPAEPALTNAHSPQAAPMSPAHGPIPAADPGGYPHEPPPPHDPSGGGDHGSSGSGGHNSADGSGHGDTSSSGLTGEKRDEIIAMEKGARPDPSEYLPQEYIQHHLEQFDKGGTRFMLKDTFDDFGIGQVDGTTFVFPSSEIDALMEATKGDSRALEQALGLPDGYFKDNVIRVDIQDLEPYNFRIPSGNEAGANAKWLPGGLLPQGMPEAVIDGSKVPLEDLTVNDLPEVGRK